MIPSISQNLQRNGLKIMVLVLSIENLWNTLKVKVHKRNPQNIKQLGELCKDEWGKVTLDQCGKLVANYRKRLEAVKKKTEATQQNIKLMYPILLHRVILNFDEKTWIQP